MTKRLLQYLFWLSFCVSMSSCSRHPEEQAQGYIEGLYTYMASSVAGVLTDLLVERGDSVKQGQLLFVLEHQPESDSYQAAIDSLNETIAGRDVVAANLAYARITYERNQVLVPKKAIQQSELDRSKASYDATIAQLEQSEDAILVSQSELAKAKWTLNQKNILAPTNALVFDTYYTVGEYAPANKAILSLLAPDNIKAIFYVPEAVLGGLHLCDMVTVQCDGCTKTYSASISFISPSAEYTPPVIYSTETSAKLIYRIEARFSREDAFRMHPGQPIVVTYHPHD